MRAYSSRRVDEFHSPIFGPSRLIVPFHRRPLRAEAHGHELALRYALQQQRPAHRLRAPFAEADVVLARAALVGIALEFQLGVLMRHQISGIRRDDARKLRPDVGLVEIEIDDPALGGAVRSSGALRTTHRVRIAAERGRGRGGSLAVRVGGARDLAARSGWL